MLVLVVVLLLLFGGGADTYGYSRWGSGGGVAIFGLVLIALHIYDLVGVEAVRP